MLKLHVHIAVHNLEESVRFYSALFATEPSVQKDDYAKWLLEEPCMNFAISTRSAKPGLDHLGIQVESETELEEMKRRLKAADLPVTSQIGETCCYVESDKHWTVDPQGIAWESFHSLKNSPTFNGKSAAANDSACCATSRCGSPADVDDSDKACCA